MVNKKLSITMGLKFELIFSIQFNTPESVLRENIFEKLLEKNIFFLNKTKKEIIYAWFFNCL